MELNYRCDNDEILYGNPGEFTIEFFQNTTPQAIANATYKLNDNRGLQIDTGTGTITDNTITISINPDIFTEYQDNCSLIVEFQVSGNTKVICILFDVVKYQMFCPVNDTNLTANHPDINDYLWKNQDSYRQQIKEAFNEVKKDIKKRGSRARLLVDTRQLTPLIKLKTFEIIFDSFTGSQGENWFQLAEKYRNQYETEIATTTFIYDTDNDTIPDKTQTSGNIQLKR